MRREMVRLRDIGSNSRVVGLLDDGCMGGVNAVCFTEDSIKKTISVVYCSEYTVMHLIVTVKCALVWEPGPRVVAKIAAARLGLSSKRMG